MENQSKIKDFQIIKKIGDGSFSQVFLAKRQKDQNFYAIKKIKLNQMSYKEQQNSLNEVRILASIKNANIIQYKDAFIDESSQTLQLVLEYANQGDILGKINVLKKKQENFSEQEIWKCIIHILTGLQALHSQKICHRDIKCGNIFISQDQDNKTFYKLGDFNVSKITKNDIMETQTGTPYYCAPEIWKNQLYDCKSDIWSLGCVIYEMASFRPPFLAQSMEQLCKKIIKADFQRIDNSYSDDLAQFIKECLKSNPNQRPTSKQLLNNSILKRKAYEFIQTDSQNSEFIDLINTIKMPLSLRQLSQQLPKSNYETPILKEKSSNIQKNSSFHDPNQLINQKEKQILQHLTPDLQMLKKQQEINQKNKPRNMSIFCIQKLQQIKEINMKQPYQNEYSAINLR